MRENSRQQRFDHSEVGARSPDSRRDPEAEDGYTKESNGAVVSATVDKLFRTRWTLIGCLGPQGWNVGGAISRVLPQVAAKGEEKRGRQAAIRNSKCAVEVCPCAPQSPRHGLKDREIAQGSESLGSLIAVPPASPVYFVFCLSELVQSQEEDAAYSILINLHRKGRTSKHGTEDSRRIQVALLLSTVSVRVLWCSALPSAALQVTSGRADAYRDLHER